MPHALFPVAPRYLLAGAVVAAGLWGQRDRGEATAHAQPQVVSAARPRVITPLPRLPITVSIEGSDGGETELEDNDLEQVRGHATIEDPAEFAMVFEVDGTSYLRLSSKLRAKSRGKARMIVDGEVRAVVAPVAASALPAELAAWSGRTVLVNGTCRARVIGFAEVSRTAGDPPGSDAYYYSAEHDELPAEQPTWTIENITADNVTLAAKLDGCRGTWARSTDYEPVQVARAVEAPALESIAIADLLASKDAVDPIQDEWKERGGDGDWRDAVDVEAMTYEHSVTGETWIFAKAYKEGGCGDASVSRMAAYRVGKSGTVRRFTDLAFAAATIQDVVDLDGDGQPELVVRSADGSTDLIDLAETHHDSIQVSYHHYGCGC